MGKSLGEPPALGAMYPGATDVERPRLGRLFVEASSSVLPKLFLLASR